MTAVQAAWAFWRRIKSAISSSGISFIGLHYIYIISAVIVGSVIIYPIRNMAYIDALFMASGSSTQAGLNTVNVNDLFLYQQIVLYLVPMVTTPIFIHSSVVFLRLYWFEKHFKDIKVQSKIQSRMRRTATMAQMRNNDDIEMQPTNIPKPGKNQHSGSSSTPVDPLEEERKTPDSVSAPPLNKDIRFGELPQPHRQIPVAPKDVYESLNMMQRNRMEFEDEDDGDGPALVIKGPREMDEEHERQELQGTVHSHIGANAEVDEKSKEQGSDATAHESDSIEHASLARKRSHDDSLESSDEEDGHRLTRSVSLAISTPKEFAGVEMGTRAHTIENGVFVPPGVDDTDVDERHKHRRRGRPHLRRSHTFEKMIHSARNKLSNREESTDRIRLQRTMTANYLSWEPTVGRNSQFVALNQQQKEELGGVEYRALKLLAKILVCYYVGFHLLGLFMLLPWGDLTTKYADYIRSCGVNTSWWAIFTAESAFNDVGFTLTPDSMSSFTHAVYVQLVMSFLIVIGNTGFPCALRFIIWVMFKLSPKFGQTHESLAFLLDHPRRCFTLLFPSSATWWLFAVLVVLNSVDLIFFIILDLNNDAVVDIPVGYRITSGLFQAFATRTAGFTIVNIADLHAGIQVSYMIMMYISVLPIAISIRRTNVYEEQSLGVYYNSKEDEEGGASYVSNHLRRQLSFDLWYIFLGLFVVCIAEGGKIGNKSLVSFDIFACLFEIVSAYGTVGLSLGYPNTNTSFSAQFNVIGKLVIIAMMIRGRHRGLPYALDRAVIKPSSKLEEQDLMLDEQARNNKIARETTLPQSLDQHPTQTNTAVTTGISRRASFGSGVQKLRRMSLGTIAIGPPASRVNRAPTLTLSNTTTWANPPLGRTASNPFKGHRRTGTFGSDIDPTMSRNSMAVEDDDE